MHQQRGGDLAQRQRGARGGRVGVAQDLLAEQAAPGAARGRRGVGGDLGGDRGERRSEVRPGPRKAVLRKGEPAHLPRALLPRDVEAQAVGGLVVDDVLGGDSDEAHVLRGGRAPEQGVAHPPRVRHRRRRQRRAVRRVDREHELLGHARVVGHLVIRQRQRAPREHLVDAGVVRLAQLAADHLQRRCGHQVRDAGVGGVAPHLLPQELAAQGAGGLPALGGGRGLREQRRHRGGRWAARVGGVFTEILATELLLQRAPLEEGPGVEPRRRADRGDRGEVPERLAVPLVHPAEPPELPLHAVVEAVVVRVARGQAVPVDVVHHLHLLQAVHRKRQLRRPGGARVAVAYVPLRGRGVPQAGLQPLPVVGGGQQVGFPLRHQAHIAHGCVCVGRAGGGPHEARRAVPCRCWSKVKHWVRRIAARGMEELNLALAQAVERVTPPTHVGGSSTPATWRQLEREPR